MIRAEVLTLDQLQNLTFWGVTAMVTLGIDILRRYLYKRIDLALRFKEQEDEENEEEMADED